MHSRPNFLLVLLVLMPLSLLAWLGMHLARSAAQRSAETRELVRDVRFAQIDPALIGALERQTDDSEKAALLPAFLAVASGCVLVLGLGWMYYRESRRAMSEALQRVTFVNQVSHELKTPLTNIQLYAEMAAHRAEKTGDQTAARYLGVVGAETSRLSRLISNVLAYSRKQRNKLTVNPKSAVLDEVVAEAVTRWAPLWEGKGIAIETSLHAPETMRLDADVIIQILGNLLSNVEKYAATGGMARIITTMDARQATLTVEDKGPGIPDRMHRRVFEAFERVRSDLNEGASGTGIGLTISRELAQAHGGTLNVDPAYRDGARFVLTIPKN